MAGLKLVCIAVVCMVLASASVDAITCGFVTSSLAPCIKYAMGKVSAVPPECCTGIKSLNNAAKTTQDRQTTCACLKQLATSGINFGTVALLPGKCGVSIPYKLSPNTDCKTVK